MLAARTRLFFSRLAALLGLALIISISSGCATRALMSSDRYEKPEPETHQFRSSDDISRSWQPDGLMLAQVYLAAVDTEKTKNSDI